MKGGTKLPHLRNKREKNNEKLGVGDNIDEFSNIESEDGYISLDSIVCKVDDILTSPSKFIYSCKKKFNDFANRNSIQTPLPKELNFILNGKKVSFNVFIGEYEIANVRSKILQIINKGIDILIGKRDDVRINNGVLHYDLLEKGVYKSGKGVSNIKLVRLKDKGVYLYEVELKEIEKVISLLKSSDTLNKLFYSYSTDSLTKIDKDILNGIRLHIYTSLSGKMLVEIEKFINKFLREKIESILKILYSNNNGDFLLQEEKLLLKWGLKHNVYLGQDKILLAKILGNEFIYESEVINNYMFESLLDKIMNIEI